MERLILVIPVWNDSERLKRFAPDLLAAIRASKRSIHIVIADDGSTESEVSRLQLLVRRLGAKGQSVELLCFDQHRRKGGAIYAAWDRFPDADWLAFVDADGAVSGASIINLFDRAIENGPNSCVIGVRRDTRETEVRRRFWRHCYSHIFHFLIRSLVGLKAEDSQCGAKVISGNAYRKIRPKLKEHALIFDVELLLFVKNSRVKLIQCPVTWTEQGGGKIKPMRDAWGMLGGLGRIRKRLYSGQYRF